MTLMSFASLANKVAVSATGCPTPVIEGYIRDAAIRTCERTHYWRAMLPPVVLTPGVWTYDFTGMPEGSEVYTLLGASLNGMPLSLLTPEVMACCFPAWDDSFENTKDTTIEIADAVYDVPYFDDDTLYNSVLRNVTNTIETGSQPQAIGRVSPCNFVILPKPDGDKPYNLRLYVALRPAPGSTGMDECVLKDLNEAIVHGALQELLILPGTHWTNPELAGYHARQYSYKTNERRARANLGFSRGALVAHPQPFGV